MMRAYLDGNSWFDEGAWEAAASIQQGVKR